MSQVEEIHWPPRSPHEALMSTPGGRARLQRLAELSPPSPSPVKRSKTILNLRRAQKLLEVVIDEDDEEDEETLQLQLQEIQARLKLKKFQKKSKQSSDAKDESAKTGSGPSQSNSVAANLAESAIDKLNSVAASCVEPKIFGLLENRVERPKSKAQAELNVPASPIRRIQPAQVQRSPGRVLLGIDKGLKGNDVSLKKAPCLRRREENVFNHRLARPFLHRSGSQARSLSLVTTPSTRSSDDRPKSFNERLAAIRSQDKDQEEREARIKRSRSAAFDIEPEQMQRFKDNAVDFPEAPRKIPEFSRDDVLNNYTKPRETSSRNNRASNLRSAYRDTVCSTNLTAPTPEESDKKKLSGVARRPSKKAPNEVTESEASQFEPYSSQHLTKRIVPHQSLTRTLSGKKAYLIPDLLREVNGPNFSGPDIEEDLVVFGIIASKSDPKAHQQKNPQKHGKFMVMTLTDLKWELDLFLFDSAFEKFWKMTPGTLLAILNPLFMAPPRGKSDTGRFSLVLNSNADTVLEIGTARDLGFCKSVKRDGKTCDAWVDKRHTEFCDFHVNISLEKLRASRMEVNSMTFGKGKKYNSAEVAGHEKRKVEQQTRYDRQSRSNIFIGGKSTVSLLDDVDFDPDAFHRGSTKQERIMRRILSQEKEAELGKKLASMGSGLGSEYARVQQMASAPAAVSTSVKSIEAPPNAISLGLMGARSQDVALSPVKRKRTNTLSSTAARGWGNDLAKDLGRMKDGERLSRPVKKTRFVTENGIREAGRESIGGDAVTVMAHDDSDDELDIVRE